MLDILIMSVSKYCKFCNKIGAENHEKTCLKFIEKVKEMHYHDTYPNYIGNRNPRNMYILTAIKAL
jgi:hypothetical protein